MGNFKTADIIKRGASLLLSISLFSGNLAWADVTDMSNPASVSNLPAVSASNVTTSGDASQSDLNSLQSQVVLPSGVTAGTPFTQWGNGVTDSLVPLSNGDTEAISYMNGNATITITDKNGNPVGNPQVFSATTGGSTTTWTAAATPTNGAPVSSLNGSGSGTLQSVVDGSLPSGVTIVGTPLTESGTDANGNLITNQIISLSNGDQETVSMSGSTASVVITSPNGGQIGNTQTYAYTAGANGASGSWAQNASSASSSSSSGPSASTLTSLPVSIPSGMGKPTGNPLIESGNGTTNEIYNLSGGGEENIMMSGDSAVATFTDSSGNVTSTQDFTYSSTSNSWVAASTQSSGSGSSGTGSTGSGTPAPTGGVVPLAATPGASTTGSAASPANVSQSALNILQNSVTLPSGVTAGTPFTQQGNGVTDSIVPLSNGDQETISYMNGNATVTINDQNGNPVGNPQVFAIGTNGTAATWTAAATPTNGAPLSSLNGTGTGTLQSVVGSSLPSGVTSVGTPLTQSGTDANGNLFTNQIIQLSNGGQETVAISGNTATVVMTGPNGGQIGNTQTYTYALSADGSSGSWAPNASPASSSSSTTGPSVATLTSLPLTVPTGVGSPTGNPLIESSNGITNEIYNLPDGDEENISLNGNSASVTYTDPTGNVIPITNSSGNAVPVQTFTFNPATGQWGASAS